MHELEDGYLTSEEQAASAWCFSRGERLRNVAAYIDFGESSRRRPGGWMTGLRPRVRQHRLGADPRAGTAHTEFRSEYVDVLENNRRVEVVTRLRRDADSESGDTSRRNNTEVIRRLTLPLAQ